MSALLRARRHASPGSRLLSAACLIVLSLFAAFFLFPILLCILNSLKTQGEMLRNVLALPAIPRLENYAASFVKTRYLRSLGNTLLVAVTGLSGMILFSSMAGYKLSRTKGALSSVIFGLFVMSMLIPFYSIMISLTKIARDLRVQGSLGGLGLVYIGLGVSMATFLYHGFVKSIPLELEEAAVIDGCGEFRLFIRIVFPLLLPVTATIAILNALWIWNDFLLPLLMITDSRRYTLLLSTTMLFGEYGNNQWTAICATLTMAMLPALLFYLLLQKYIIQGIAEGALKG
jgi:raffinose/stachyose/melibiose transport system permease protein